MKKFILGKKVGMTQIINEDGLVLPVTVVKVDKCTVVRIIQEDKSGYNAVLLGYGEKKKCNRPQAIFFEKAGVDPKKVLREFRNEEIDTYKVGEEIAADIFEKNEKVNVRGRSIGKGFQGTVKRHNFSRGPMTHGSKNHRRPGSIGGGTTPGRVIKGKKMPGHMGNENVCIKNVKVVLVDKESGLIYLNGAVPGKKESLVSLSN
jgi:large subunit ribosomal protein L3